MDAIRFRVRLHARPAIGRTFYEGYVDVVAVDEEAAARAARNEAAKTHGHRDWVIDDIRPRSGPPTKG